MIATFAALLLSPGTVPASAQGQPRVVEVGDDTSLRAALADAAPGDQIRIAPGEYRPGVYAHGLQGTQERPIVIEGADAQHPPSFRGGSQAWHLSDCCYVTLRNLVFSGQRINGLNVDDGGSFDTPSHHLTLENLRVSEIGPRGNFDAIKISGVDDFTVRGCTIRGWGGQAIDMVGCHRGLIERCSIQGQDGYTQHTGPQTKGGSSEIVIRRCVFRNAGMRSVNIGGSTGLDFFRPQGTTYEARDITVEGCVFIGSTAPVAYVGVDGATVRYNTILYPDKWVLRILQETTAPGFVPCRNGRFERNLIVYRRADVGVIVNIGPNTAPPTFAFTENLWYCEDAPDRSKPDLPVAETGGIYTVDPGMKEAEQQRFRPQNPAASGYGAWAWEQP